MLLILFLGTFLHKLSHFNDLSEPVDSECLGSSPREVFLTPGNSYLVGLPRGGPET